MTPTKRYLYVTPIRTKLTVFDLTSCMKSLIYRKNKFYKKKKTG